jgi:uncharacterized protein
MGFFAVVLSVLLAVWFYLWIRLVRNSKLSRSQKALALTAFVSVFLFQAAVPLLFRVVFRGKSGIPDSFFWITYSSLGFMVLLFFTTIAKDLIFLIFQIANRFQKDQTKIMSADRRLFLTRAANLSTVGIAGILTAQGTATALDGPRVKEVNIEVPGLHADLEGFRIVQVTDLHVGPTIKRKEVERVRDIVQELKPDLLAFTGDMVDGLVHQLGPHMEPLSELHAKHGTYFVSGNHDYYWDIDSWSEYMRGIGATVLDNENRILKIGGANLLVGGVRDWGCKRIRPDHFSDPHLAVATNAKVDFKLLLAHRPESCDEGAKAGFNLMICGHTHAGQFVPFHFFVSLAHKYYRGLQLHDQKMWVYVSAATGYWGPPLRLGIPSEITVLKLVRGSAIV